jgi:hypothetical protein
MKVIRQAAVRAELECLDLAKSECPTSACKGRKATMLCFQLKEAAVVKTETITMTMREVDRLKTIQAVVDGMLTALMAADRLRLTKRQVNRLVMRYRLEGAVGLVSRQRGQPGHRQLAPGV